jgi:hypothetical protein
MASDYKDRIVGPVHCEPTPESIGPAPTPRHPLFGALKGRVQVMPGTDLTEPADPAWGDGDPKK